MARERLIQTEPEVRRGHARQRQISRQQRRRRKREFAADHLTPAGGVRISLPRIRIPLFRLVAGLILAVVLLIGVVLLLRGLKPAEAQLLPNALWLGTEWTYEIHDSHDIRELASRLRDHEIGTVYAWVSWLQGDNTWRGAELFNRVKVFASQLKEESPDLALLGWISLPVHLDEDGYRLDDPELQQIVADFSSSVVRELGFDGVFLDIEPVWDGDGNFVDLLRKVRLRLGESVPVSVAVPPDWSPLDADIPVPELILPGTVWSRSYKQNVALLSDQMAVMGYNSGLTAASDYETWMAYQVQTFAEAVSALGQGTVLLIGIPTYDAEPPGHDPDVENVVTALNGLRAGLAAAGPAAAWVQGAAIYADWETDPAEWEQFQLLAVDNR